MKITPTLFVLILTMLLAGCSFEPAFHKPVAQMPKQYPADSPSAGATASQGTLLDWQGFFVDHDLKTLITLALKHNKDLQTAALDVAKYQAEYRISRANLAPQIDLSASSTNKHSTGATSHSDSLTVGTSSWELDFFGRLRSLKHQALQQYLATQASEQSTRISLIASVATDYLQLLADQQSLRLAQQAVDDYRQGYHLAEQTLTVGSYTLTDVNTAKANLASAQADVAAYQQAVAEDWHNLAQVMGTSIPDGIRQRAPVDLLTNRFTTPIQAKLPSSLLTNRPDIIAAEHNLKAANANIGAARAAFFPSISLTSSAGFASSSLGNLFHSGSWTFTPSISLPIFDFGTNQADLDVAKIEKNLEIVNYQQTIQTAFKEVANALSDRKGYAQQFKSNQNYLDALSSQYQLTQTTYHVGTDSLYDLLSAAESYHSAQVQLVSVRLEQLSNQITLYKVLGGGWKPRS
ncbi:efflux transporter outer membrane subunit [Celerinatantimonas yamalensis]|uniref:Efflux transporter outer membrane subunit n=1 Tax=Celerinatantimonas yamalensis TaxID=559956 RepID=A0ABW9G5I8_9GAMM